MAIYHTFMAIFKHQIYSNLIMYKYLPHICYKQTKKSCFFAVKLIFKHSQCIFFDPRKFLNQPTTASTFPYSTDTYYKNIPKAEFYFLLIVCIKQYYLPLNIYKNGRRFSFLLFSFYHLHIISSDYSFIDNIICLSSYSSSSRACSSSSVICSFPASGSFS